MTASQLLGRICIISRGLGRCHSFGPGLVQARSSAIVGPGTSRYAGDIRFSCSEHQRATLAEVAGCTLVSNRCFSSQPVQPNPLGNTNTSGVGADPVGTSSAPNTDKVLPSPLSASTNIPSGSSASTSTGNVTSSSTPVLPSSNSSKPDPLAATTNVAPNTSSSSAAPKPDPLAASTNVAATASSSSATSKPDPLAASTNVASSSASSTSPKPDPLAASTNVAPDTTASATESSSYNQSTYDGPPKLVVFGGNGFVGTRVCEEALNTGLAVVSISRSATPKVSAHWTSQVDWVSADAFEPEQWRDQLQGAVGVVSCLGAFGSNDFMLKVCGQANVGVIREAAQAGVPRCAFISIHDYPLPSFVLSGYFEGKRNAEHAMAASFPDTGVCLRPSFIHGTRYVSGSIGLPLSWIGSPLAKGLGFLPAKTLSSVPVAGAAFVPPISVQAVAKAAVAAATDSSVPGGILDIWQLQNYEQ